jgi:hypothetical protein
MIKREHIKQAIDAISSRDSDMGYSLDEMLGMGLIDIPSGEDGTEGDSFYFFFDGEKVLVNRVLFFNEGIVPIEQGLLIKFGELVRKHELHERPASQAYRDAFKEIHEAGLRTAVIHELDYAIARLRKKVQEGTSSSEGRRLEHLIAFLEKLKAQGALHGISENEGAIEVIYRGVIDAAKLAYFVKFPVSMDTLMQVADINVEFFHVRFVLNCLIRGTENNLLACVSDGDILGLVFISLKEYLFKKDLEIKYLATLRGKSWADERPNYRPPKGVGTFLVAGVWMLRKNEMPSLREIVLDSELGARPFYEAVGFESRGFSGYVLKEPRGYLLRAILSMTHECPDLKQEAAGEIEDLVRKQIKRLGKKAKGERGEAERRASIAAVMECFKPEAKQKFAEAAVDSLIKYRRKIPEWKEMLQFALDHGSDEMKACIVHAASSDH